MKSVRSSTARKSSIGVALLAIPLYPNNRLPTIAGVKRKSTHAKGATFCLPTLVDRPARNHENIATILAHFSVILDLAHPARS